MDKEFYIENRRRLAAHMMEHEAMLFFSGESLRKTADENFPFFTNRNFLYLTGIKQEQSALLLQKKGDLVSECLFVTKPDFEREIWTGRRLTAEEIHELSGIEGVESIENLSSVLDELFIPQPAMTLWLCFDALAPERSFDIEREFAKHLQKRHPQIVSRTVIRCWLRCGKSNHLRRSPPCGKRCKSRRRGFVAWCGSQNPA